MHREEKGANNELTSRWTPLLMRLYYLLKPAIPRRLQIILRRKRAERIKTRSAAFWPISPHSATPPEDWKGWKDDKAFALILTHDVDTVKGYQQHRKLLEIEKRMGFVSSFNFVPERYPLDRKDLANVQQQGFEVGVHGLHHDGKLFESENIFRKRAAKINEYLKDWGAVGFRAPAMHHNLEWIKSLNIEYDASTFDTDPFEPQSEGVSTIFPFPVADGSQKRCYWELPYTLPQDFTMFVIFKENSIDIWRKKLDWIAEKGGMGLLNIHPDYINFGDRPVSQEEFSVRHYIDFLDYVKQRYSDAYWNPLPKDLVKYLNEKYE